MRQCQPLFRFWLEVADEIMLQSMLSVVARWGFTPHIYRSREAEEAWMIFWFSSDLSRVKQMLQNTPEIRKFRYLPIWQEWKFAPMWRRYTEPYPTNGYTYPPRNPKLPEGHFIRALIELLEELCGLLGLDPVSLDPVSPEYSQKQLWDQADKVCRLIVTHLRTAAVRGIWVNVDEAGLRAYLAEQALLICEEDRSFTEEWYWGSFDWETED